MFPNVGLLGERGVQAYDSRILPIVKMLNSSPDSSEGRRPDRLQAGVERSVTPANTKAETTALKGRKNFKINVLKTLSHHWG